MQHFKQLTLAVFTANGELYKKFPRFSAAKKKILAEHTHALDVHLMKLRFFWRGV